MAISDVDIANTALQKLGAQPITSFLDNTTRAADINRTYFIYRDKLQRMRWNFNRAYVNLPALTTSPPFEYKFAYQLPSDYLRLEMAGPAQPVGALPPGSIPAGPIPTVFGMPGINLADYNNGRSQDYRIVGLQIWSNIPAPLSIVYGQRITDPNRFDAAFAEMFACYLAWQLCERVTGSNAKKPTMAQEYKEALFEAKAAKAIELPPETIPDDTFLLSRIGY